jgi:hypothetical protein
MAYAPRTAGAHFRHGERLFEQVMFVSAKPTTILLTTQNREFNAKW